MIFDRLDGGEEVGRHGIVCRDPVEHEVQQVKVKVGSLRSQLHQQFPHPAEIKVHELLPFLPHQFAITVVEVQVKREPDEEGLRLDDVDPFVDQLDEPLPGGEGAVLIIHVRDQTQQLFPKDGHQDIIFCLEMREDEPFGDPRLLCNLICCCGGEPFPGKQFQGGGEDGVPALSLHGLGECL